MLVATVGSGDREIIVGLGEYARSGAAAEIAFAVEEDFQRRGIASRLLRQLVDIARANGIVRFEGDVLAENTGDCSRSCATADCACGTSHAQGVVHATLFLTSDDV